MQTRVFFAFFLIIFSVSKQRYVLPHYRWTSNTPSSTVSISSSAITANSTSFSHRKVFELFVLLLFSARIAVFLHSGFWPSRSNVKSGDTSYKRKASCINHWLHIVTTKNCYLLMVALKCQWPIFLHNHSSERGGPELLWMFCQNTFSCAFSWELHSQDARWVCCSL